MSNPPTPKEIRLLCDGEMSSQDAAVVEAKLREHAEPRARAEFERRLRERVGAVLKTGSPPADLADRIREAISPEAATASLGTPGTIEPPPEPSIHRPWWRGTTRANTFAVAASLVLVAGAVLFGIYGPEIDSRPHLTTIDVVAAAAAAVAQEHMQSAMSPTGRTRLHRYPTPDLAASGLGERLGDAGCVADLSDLGYAFLGADACDGPGCGSGCHLIYKRTEGRGRVSLHVMPRSPELESLGSPELQALPILTDKIARNRDCPMNVLVWSHGNHSYMLVTCVAGDTEMVAEQMQRALLAGKP